MGSLRRLYAPLAGAICLALGVTGAQAQTVLKFGHTNPEAHEFGHGARVFKKELEAATDGRYRIEIFPNSQLGGEREMVESVQLGTLDLVLSTTGPLANFVPDVGVTDIPFIFRDAGHARQVFDGPIGQDLLEKFRKRGLTALAWSDQGFRHLSNQKHPVRTPEDMKGLKIRTMENPVHIQAFKTLGVLASPLSWPEVVPALQQGVVDGAEIPVTAMQSLKWWQFQRNVTLTGHVFSSTLIIVSPRTFDALSPADQEAFRQAARKASEAQRAYVDERQAAALAQLKAEGMDVVETIDTAAFQKALEPAYASFAKKYGRDKIDAILNVK